MLVDSHCHLDFPDFAGEGVAAVLNRARAAGVSHFMTICTHLSRFDGILAVAESAPDVNCTVGTHPHQAGEAAEKIFTAAQIVEMSRHPKVAGIGECGLDYFYDYATKEDQHACFIRQIEAAVETDLPVVIHSRDAEEDTIRLMKEAGGGKLRGVMHCFTGSQWLADQALDLGFYISFSGIVTFKKSDDLRAVAKTVPADRILVETDSPYLAPMPYRGKRNEPAYVAHTAASLAETRGEDVAQLIKNTGENFLRLFSRVKPC